MIIRAAEVSDLNEMIEIHKMYLNEGLFSRFSKRFLKSFYKLLLSEESTKTYVLVDKKQILGFITGTLSLEKLRTRVIQRLWFVLGLEVLFYPQLLFKFLKLNLYPSFEILGKAEILSVVLVPNSRGSGAGSKLIKRMITFFEDNNCKLVIVSVRDRLVRANKFYNKNGFKKIKQINFLDEEVNIWQYQIN